MSKKQHPIKDAVPINCSCPNCQNLLVLPLCVNNEQPDVIQRVQEATGVSLGVLGVYAFDGNIRCERCGKFVIASLTVSAHEQATSLQ